jgi:type IV secretory pathway VirB3-like protein
MSMSTIIIVILALLLYLAIGFIVWIVHTLGSRQEPSGLKKIFLAPFNGLIWLVMRFDRPRR